MESSMRSPSHPSSFERAESYQKGFGYVFVSQAAPAVYIPLGQHFTISFLPENLPIQGSNICIWMGSDDALKRPQLMMESILIWPGQGVINMGTLSTKQGLQKSCVLTLGQGSYIFTTGDIKSEIALELLTVHQKPCILFIHWDDPNTEAVANESLKLSSLHLAQGLIINCTVFFKGREIKIGKAVPSSALSEWYDAALEKLDQEEKHLFLCDPTALVAGILKHMADDLLSTNKLDITGDVQFIPTKFIEDWSQKIRQNLCGGEQDSVLRSLLQL